MLAIAIAACILLLALAIAVRRAGWVCRTFHRTPMWPIHGRYVCPQCLREWPVAWSVEAKSAGDWTPAAHASPSTNKAAADTSPSVAALETR